jgi:hypothetical protein
VVEYFEILALLRLGSKKFGGKILEKSTRKNLSVFKVTKTCDLLGPYVF